MFACATINDKVVSPARIRFDPNLNDLLCRRVISCPCTPDNDYKIRQICTHIMNEYSTDFTSYPETERETVRRIRDLVFRVLVSPCMHDRMQLFKHLYALLCANARQRSSMI